MTVYAIQRSIPLAEERFVCAPEEMSQFQYMLKRRMVTELAAAFMEAFGSKEFTRDKFTGELTLRFTAQIMEDAQLERLEARAERRARKAQKDADDAAIPYGLDQSCE